MKTSKINHNPQIEKNKGYFISQRFYSQDYGVFYSLTQLQSLFFWITNYYQSKENKKHESYKIAQKILNLSKQTNWSIIKRLNELKLMNGKEVTKELREKFDIPKLKAKKEFNYTRLWEKDIRTLVHKFNLTPKIVFVYCAIKSRTLTKEGYLKDRDERKFTLKTIANDIHNYEYIKNYPFKPNVKFDIWDISRIVAFLHKNKFIVLDDLTDETENVLLHRNQKHSYYPINPMPKALITDYKEFFSKKSNATTFSPDFTKNSYLGKNTCFDCDDNELEEF